MERDSIASFLASELALVRARCLDLGFYRAAATLRHVAPRVHPEERSQAREPNGVTSLLDTLLTLETRLKGREEGQALARARALIEEELWP